MPKKRDKSRADGRKPTDPEGPAAKLTTNGVEGAKGPTIRTRERLQWVEEQMLRHRVGRTFERDIGIRFGVGIRQARKYVELVRLRWVKEAEARGDLAAKKAAAVQRLMAIAAEAPERRDRIAAEKLIAEIEGTKAPMKLDLSGFDPKRATTEQLARIAAGEPPEEVLGAD